MERANWGCIPAESFRAKNGERELLESFFRKLLISLKKVCFLKLNHSSEQPQGEIYMRSYYYFFVFDVDFSSEYIIFQ